MPDPHRHDEAIARMERGLARQEKRRAAGESARKHAETIVSDAQDVLAGSQGERLLKILEGFADMPLARDLLRLSSEDAMKLIARREGFSDLVRFLRLAAAGDVEAVLRGPHQTWHART